MSTSNNPQLKKIGRKIAKADQDLVSVLSTRLNLSKEIAKIKLKHGIPFVREEIEMERLDQISVLAKKAGLNREFIRAILYIIIGESCKKQLIVSDDVRLKSSRKKFKANRVIG